jgi:hypothetical protein
VSYLRRYLVCMIFNVATADDNDGNGGGGAGKRMDEKVLEAPRPDQRLGDEADVLKRFAAAYNEAEDLKDKDAQRQFLGARDNRRKELKGGRRA